MFLTKYQTVPQSLHVGSFSLFFGLSMWSPPKPSGKVSNKTVLNGHCDTRTIWSPARGWLGLRWTHYLVGQCWQMVDELQREQLWNDEKFLEKHNMGLHRIGYLCARKGFHFWIEKAVNLHPMYRNPHKFSAPKHRQTHFAGMRTRVPTKTTKAHRKISEELSGLTQTFDFDLGYNDNMIHFSPIAAKDGVWFLSRCFGGWQEWIKFLIWPANEFSLFDRNARFRRSDWKDLECNGCKEMEWILVYFHLMRWRDFLRSQVEPVGMCKFNWCSAPNKANQFMLQASAGKSTELQRIGGALEFWRVQEI